MSTESDARTRGNDERQSDLAVMEANEYKQKRRLKRILDTRDYVEDTAADAFEAYSLGEITKEAKNITLLSAAKRYIRETYQLLADHANTRDGNDPQYLTGTPNDKPLGILDFEHCEPLHFSSLADVLDANEIYTETWTTTKTRRHGPDTTIQHEQQYTVPDTVSWNAYLLVNKFLSDEHDLELRFEELDDSLPVWGFEEVHDEPGTEELSDRYQGDNDQGDEQSQDETKVI